MSSLTYYPNKLFNNYNISTYKKFMLTKETKDDFVYSAMKREPVIVAIKVEDQDQDKDKDEDQAKTGQDQRQSATLRKVLLVGNSLASL